MEITRSNYESWFLDFLEGNLDTSVIDDFLLFLKDNPDLASELKMVDMLVLEPNKSINFDSKNRLEKSPADEHFEFAERAVAYHEGDLSSEGQKNFEACLSENSANAAEAAQFGKMKLVADKTIVYKNKGQLKRNSVTIPLWTKIASIAALLFLAYLLFHPHNQNQSEFAQVADDLKNKKPDNIVVPEKKGNFERKKGVENPPFKRPVKLPTQMPIKQKPVSFREKGVTKIDSTSIFRVPEPAPAPLKPQTINFGLPERVELANITIKDSMPSANDQQLSELLKVQLAAIRESDDREILSSQHIGLSGLQLFARLSGKRLTARKGNDGVVRSVSYNSRLLAFSIPINR